MEKVKINTSDYWGTADNIIYSSFNLELNELIYHAEPKIAVELEPELKKQELDIFEIGDIVIIKNQFVSNGLDRHEIEIWKDKFCKIIEVNINKRNVGESVYTIQEYDGETKRIYGRNLMRV